MATCQRCRQPIRNSSSSSLNQSSFDLLASHLPDSGYYNNTQNASSAAQFARLPPSLQAAYGVPARPASPMLRRNVAGQPPHPTESFVMLTESQVRPSPSSDSSATGGSSPDQDKSLVSSHLRHSENIYNLLSSKTEIDHPLCSDCADLLQDAMTKQLEEVKKERERYLAFEKQVAGLKYDPEEAVNLQKEIEQVKSRETGDSHAVLITF